MKKMLSFLLALAMILSISVSFGSLTVPALAEAVHAEVAQLADTQPADTQPANNIADEEHYRIAPDDLFPFVFSDGSDFAWYRENVVGESDCVSGYLYVKDMKTGQITQILEEPVSRFRETQDYLYCVTADQKLICTDYTGSIYIHLYGAMYGDIKWLDYYANSLYFVDGEHVIKYSIADGTAATLIEQAGIETVYPFAVDQLLLTTDMDETIYLNIETGETCALETEAEINEVLTGYTVFELDPMQSDMGYATYDFQVKFAQSFPLPDYPVGSHFSVGGDCDHKNKVYYCRTYAQSNQCDGFARYAHEQFIHHVGSASSAPYRPAGDTHYISGGGTPALNSVSAVKTFFNSLMMGAFIRYTKTQSDTTGFHSAVFMNTDSTGVWVYECNQDYKCGVSITHYNYEVFITRYPYVAIYVSHTFAGTVTQYSASCHKVKCVNCDGYVYCEHSMNNGTCRQCGYTSTAVGLS